VGGYIAQPWGLVASFFLLEGPSCCGTAEKEPLGRPCSTPPGEALRRPQRCNHDGEAPTRVAPLLRQAGVACRRGHSPPAAQRLCLRQQRMCIPPLRQRPQPANYARSRAERGQRAAAGAAGCPPSSPPAARESAVLCPDILITRHVLPSDIAIMLVGAVSDGPRYGAYEGARGVRGAPGWRALGRRRRIKICFSVLVRLPRAAQLAPESLAFAACKTPSDVLRRGRRLYMKGRPHTPSGVRPETNASHHRPLYGPAAGLKTGLYLRNELCKAPPTGGGERVSAALARPHSPPHIDLTERRWPIQ
jgi:hypothetical protein